MHKQILKTMRWETVPREWADFYKSVMPAGSKAALVAAEIVNDIGLPEYSIVAVGEANIERFLTEYEWNFPQTVEAVILQNERAIKAGMKPHVPRFAKVKKSELLENRRTKC